MTGISTILSEADLLALLKQKKGQYGLPKKTSSGILPGRKFLSKSGHALLTIMLLCVATVSFAQKLTIRGKVSDKSGPIPGVTVTVKDTKIVTSTNTTGDYTVVVPNKNAVLVYTFIGYTTQEVPVIAKSTINITLIESSSNLNEVVVVGYGSVRKRDLTGSVATVNMADVQKAPVTSIDQALGGRIAGVQVVSSDGQPGANAEITIRGVGSVTQSTAPLYVIDGFPQEDANFNSINPADIQSIEVLKDASATAIYGARGSNGVIIITTKRGESPKPTINYNTSMGFQQSIGKIKLMNAYEYVQLQNDVNPTWANYVYFANGKTLEDYKDAPTIDWQDLLSNKNPIFQTHNISVSGKSNKTSYLVSGSYNDQAGLIIQSGFRRYQGRIVLDQEYNDRFKVGVNVNYADTKSYGSIPSVQNTPAGTTANSSAFNLMNTIWQFRPVLSARTLDLNAVLNDLTDYNVDEGGIPGTNVVNPYVNVKNQVNNRFTNSLSANSYIEYTILKGLKLRVTGGLTINNGKNNVFNNSNTQSGSPLTSYGAVNGVNGSVSTNNSTSFLNENTLNYSKSINKNNSFSALIGYTFQNSNTSSYSFSAVKLPNEALGINGIGQGTPSTISSGSSLNAMQSYLGRVNYNLSNKYLFTANFRADGSSKFYKDNRWGYFPSGAFAWRFSDEPFMKNIKVIDNGKLRASYGIIGNNRVTDFAYLSQITTGSNIYTSIQDQNVYGSIVSSPSNNNLKWETTYETDFGLDLSFFQGKITFEADYYKRITKNLLLNAALPYTSGYTNAFENIGSVSNQGLEFTVTTVNISKKDFSWNTSFNISFNRNRVLELTGNQESILTSKSFTAAAASANYIAKVGRPVAQFYGYVADGNYQLSDFYKIPNGTTGYYYVLKENIPYYASKNTLSAPQSNATLVVQPGDPKFKDLNGDGIINSDDYTTIGSPYPIHFGGLSNNFTYKSFDLNVFMQWSYGNQVMDANRIAFEGGTSAPQTGTSLTANQGMVNTNQWETYVNRWTPTNPSNEYPRVNANTGGTRQYSSRIIEDASFLRLKTVSLGYNLPRKLMNRVNITNFRISLAAQNLVTWTRYQGPDPEVSTGVGNNLTPGFDFSPYPRTRVITLGLNLTL